MSRAISSQQNRSQPARRPMATERRLSKTVPLFQMRHCLGWLLVLLGCACPALGQVRPPTPSGTTSSGAALGNAALGNANSPTDPSDTAPSVLLALQQSLIDAIAKAESSVVAVARSRRNEQPKLLDPDYVPTEFATGVVIDAQGLILTNAHVLGKPAESDYAVWVSGRPFYAKIKALDPWVDLAILQIEANDLTPIAMGDGDDVKKGQFVICLGNPYAIARDGNVSATWGIVSNLARKAPGPRLVDRVTNAGETVHQFGTLIQTDAKLVHGTSGGAMLNLQGEMIGLTTSLAAVEGYDRSTGYAIPMNKPMKRVIEQLKQGKQPEYGFLGVAPTNLELSQVQNHKYGAKLDSVEAGTPAAKYGLRRDDVVTHVDGTPVRSHLDLIRLVSLSPVGSEVEFQLLRQNALLRRQEQLTKSVVLTKRYVAAHEQGLWTEPIREWRGISVDYATAIPAFYQHVAEIDPEGCLVVADVHQDSPGWTAGLRPGVFVTHVAGLRVVTPAAFHTAVENQGDTPVTLRATSPIKNSLEVTVAPQ
ncbi:MAG: trypsin-like peptidase domain-containing protein [Planctomycetales bacterium]|nr:trypsin-like peptidase domain-containing protein [Planctomycetales bacterium]